MRVWTEGVIYSSDYSPNSNSCESYDEDDKKTRFKIRRHGGIGSPLQRRLWLGEVTG